jgi:hypothetical protein
MPSIKPSNAPPLVEVEEAVVVEEAVGEEEAVEEVEEKEQTLQHCNQ